MTPFFVDVAFSQTRCVREREEGAINRGVCPHSGPFARQKFEPGATSSARSRWLPMSQSTAVSQTNASHQELMGRKCHRASVHCVLETGTVTARSIRRHAPIVGGAHDRSIGGTGVAKRSMLLRSCARHLQSCGPFHFSQFSSGVCPTEDLMKGLFAKALATLVAVLLSFSAASAATIDVGVLSFGPPL